MNTWIYFATSEKTSLDSTLKTILRAKFLWRSAFNTKGARIANVGNIKPGDKIVVAWRHSGQRRMAYLLCDVAAPLLPISVGLVVDRLAGADSKDLVAAGYPKNAAGQVEGIRLDQIRECFFHVRGEYGGNNSIHKLDLQDVQHVLRHATLTAG